MNAKVEYYPGNRFSAAESAGHQKLVFHYNHPYLINENIIVLNFSLIAAADISMKLEKNATKLKQSDIIFF